MKPDFLRMARDMADNVTQRPGDGIAALAIMSEALRTAYAAGMERAAEIAVGHADLVRKSITHDREHRKRTRVYEAICIAKIIRSEKEADHG